MLNFNKKVQTIETVCNDSENPMEEQTGADKATEDKEGYCGEGCGW